MGFGPLSLLLGLAVAWAPLTAGRADASAAAADADDVAWHFVGKVCETHAGARFTFAPDGQYSYDGLWRSTGRYRVGPASITVIPDSGLERSFHVTRREAAFYIEETAVRCQ